MADYTMRARQQAPGLPYTVQARTALNVDGLTKDASGNLLDGVVVKLLRTDTDVVHDRSVSDAASKYSLSPYDTTAHYVVGFRPAVADTTLYRADLSYLTADASGVTEDVTVDSLFGI